MIWREEWLETAEKLAQGGVDIYHKCPRLTLKSIPVIQCYSDTAGDRNFNNALSWRHVWHWCRNFGFPDASWMWQTITIIDKRIDEWRHAKRSG